MSEAMNIYEIFDNLRNHHENEVVEFKKAENNFDFDDFGKYFSALCNEANLRYKDLVGIRCARQDTGNSAQKEGCGQTAVCYFCEAESADARLDQLFRNRQYERLHTGLRRMDAA